MTTRMYTGLVVFGLAALVASTAMAGVEKRIELGQVPDNVLAVAKAKLANLKLVKPSTLTVADGRVVDDDSMVVAYEPLGGVKLVGANTETENDGSFVYEIQGLLKDGRKVEIDIHSNGAIAEIEIEFKLEDVPGAVLKAIEKKMPGFKPEFIEASHSASMQVVSYEFVGAMGDKQLDIEVSADGSRIVVADQ